MRESAGFSRELRRTGGDLYSLPPNGYSKLLPTELKPFQSHGSDGISFKMTNKHHMSARQGLDVVVAVV